MKSAILFLFGILVLANGTHAKADYGDLSLAYLFGYGGGFSNYGFNNNFGPPPPYFAMHPPVYYGQRYTRPYGVSPFPTWPQLQPNAAYAPQPAAVRAQTIVNPHCCDGAIAPMQPVVQSAKQGPLEIDNPFYQPEAQYTSTK